MNKVFVFTGASQMFLSMGLVIYILFTFEDFFKLHEFYSLLLILGSFIITMHGLAVFIHALNDVNSEVSE